MNKFEFADLFWSFQGEGYNSGTRALFIRLPGCNLKCNFCDTIHDDSIEWSEDEFIEFALREKQRFAVLTGGEPLFSKQAKAVIDLLKGLDFYIACETNGTMPPIEGIDFYTVSPKRESEYFINPLLNGKINELKYVVDDRFDFSVLERHLFSPCHKFLSPEHAEMELNLGQIFEYIEENPEWRYSLQTHKFIGIP